VLYELNDLNWIELNSDVWPRPMWNKRNYKMQSVQLLGLISLGGGLFLKFGRSLLLPSIESVVSSVAKQAGATSSPSSSSSMDDGISSISELTSTVDVAAYVLVALGLFMLIVGVVGCAGACGSLRILLATVWQTETGPQHLRTYTTSHVMSIISIN